MNFLNCGSWTRYCRIPHWNYSCCKDRVASVNLKLLDENRSKKTTFSANPAKLFMKTNLFMTQVRFKDYPKLHSDCQLPNFQPYRKNQFKDVRRTDWGMGDDKYGYTYVVSFFGFLCAAYVVKTNLYQYAMYMSAAADVLAMASIEVDVAKIEPGICVSLKWRGKPLFIKHRTPAEIDKEAATPMSNLKDPQTPEQRMTNQQWLIVIGICTHLGCVPIPNSGDFVGGFYCPCHGSHYDNLGRARKGPAPTNLEVPPYKFISDTLVQVG